MLPPDLEDLLKRVRFRDPAAARARISELATDPADLLALERMGEKSADNLLAAIDASRGRGLARVLAGLGIRHIGTASAKTLAARFADIDALRAASQDDLEAVPDFGAVTAATLHAYLHSGPGRDTLKRLAAVGVDLSSPAPAALGAEASALSGKRVVLTGGLDRFTRSELTEKLESLGARVTISVSRKTDLLIAGSDPGSKADKARKLGVAMLDEKEFLKVSRGGAVKRLLAADLWPMLTTENGTVRLQRFQQRLITPLDRLLESLVLYDEVVIPTQDFMVVPALMNALGEESVRQLLDSGALRFLRIKEQFAFAAGDGACVIAVTKPSGEPLPFAQELDQLLEWISKDCTGSNDPKSFHKLLSSITSELNAAEFKNIIRDESESDVLESAQVREIFELPHTHPRDLPAAPNTIIMYGGPEVSPENKLVQSYGNL